MTADTRGLLLALLLSASLVSPTVHAQDQRAITQIAGDLYRFQNNFHYSVFLVTPGGVIVTVNRLPLRFGSFSIEPICVRTKGANFASSAPSRMSDAAA